MPISYDAKAGKAYSLDPSGEWLETKVARNPRTGETFALDGAEWKPVAAPGAPDRSLLGEVNNFVGGVADAVTQGATLGFADELGAGVRAGARYLTDAVGLTKPRTTGLAELVTREATGQGAPPSNYDRALADIRGREKQFAQEHPVASAVGNVLGGLATGRPTPSAVPAVARSLPRTIARSSATGAGMGAVAGFGAGEGGFQNRLDSAVEGAAWGAGLGAAIPAAAGTVSRVVSPFRNQLTPEARRLADVARAEGIPLSAGQATGSRPLQSLEAFFETHPLTASTQQAQAQAQRTAFNRAALRHVGEAADDLSPEVLSRARDRIKAELESLAAQTTLRPDATFAADMASARSEYSRRLDALKKTVFDNLADDIEGIVNSGGMPGATYQSTRSTLGTMARSAGAGDPYFAQALRKLRDALDDAADRAMPPDLKEAWAKARQQYGSLRALEKAMSNTTTQAASGNLSPTQLALAVKQQHPRAYGFGAGPMNDLSRVGDRFVRDQIPNSGTPERLFWQNLLTNPLSYGATGLGAAIDPVVTAATIGTSLFGPRLAQMVYNGPRAQAYFRNQRMAGAGPALVQGLLRGFAGAAGGGLLGDEPGLIPVPRER